jgi:hypothetical protein
MIKKNKQEVQTKRHFIHPKIGSRKGVCEFKKKGKKGVRDVLFFWLGFLSLGDKE